MEYPHLGTLQLKILEDLRIFFPRGSEKALQLVCCPGDLLVHQCCLTTESAYKRLSYGLDEEQTRDLLQVQV